MATCRPEMVISDSEVGVDLNAIPVPRDHNWIECARGAQSCRKRSSRWLRETVVYADTGRLTARFDQVCHRD